MKKNALHCKKVCYRETSPINKMYYDGEGFFRPKNLAFFDLLGNSMPSSNGWMAVTPTRIGGWYINGEAYSWVSNGNTTQVVNLRKEIGEELTFGGYFNGVWCGWACEGSKQQVSGRRVETIRNGVLTYTFNVGCAIEPNKVRITYQIGTTLHTSPDGIVGGTGIASASVNYATGQISVTFNTQPVPGTWLSVSYTENSYFKLTYNAIAGIGSGAQLGFYYRLLPGVKPGSFYLNTLCEGQRVVVRDNGSGTLYSTNPTVTVTGTINYATGALYVEFPPIYEPDNGAYLQATYTLRGLQSSDINFSTGTVTLNFSLAPDEGLAPDNPLCHLLYVNPALREHEKLPQDVFTCTVLLPDRNGTSCGFRTTYDWGYDGSEDEDDMYFTLRTVPNKWLTVNMYIKASANVNVMVEKWTKNISGYEISASLRPYIEINGVKNVYDIPSSPTFKFCGVKILPKTNVVTLQIGANSAIFITAIHVYDGQQDVPYQPNYSIYGIMLKPPSQDGVYVLHDGVDIYWGHINAGISSVLTINSWHSDEHFLVTGQDGTEPHVVSSNAVHTYNFPMARVLGVRRGLISRIEYDRFYHQYYQGLINNTITTNGTEPNWTYNAGTNERQLHIPEASTSGVTRGTITNAWFTKKDTEVSITNHAVGFSGTAPNFQYTPRTLTYNLPYAGNSGVTAGGISYSDYVFMNRDFSWSTSVNASSCYWSYDAYGGTLYLPYASSFRDGLMTSSTYSYLYNNTEPALTFLIRTSGAISYPYFQIEQTSTSKTVRLWLPEWRQGFTGHCVISKNYADAVRDHINAIASKLVEVYDRYDQLKTAINNLRAVCGMRYHMSGFDTGTNCCWKGIYSC